jgi:hypothetical protein
MTRLKVRTMEQQKVKNSPLKVQSIALLSGSLLLVGGLVGCDSLAESGFSLSPNNNLPITHIGDLQQKRSLDSSVYLKGRVGDQAPFLGTGAYQLQDATGSIWVVTQQTLPAKGDEVLMRGKAQYQSITVGDQDLGEVFVQEEQQLERAAAPKGWSLFPQKSHDKIR